MALIKELTKAGADVNEWEAANLKTPLFQASAAGRAGHCASLPYHIFLCQGSAQPSGALAVQGPAHRAVSQFPASSHAYMHAGACLIACPARAAACAGWPPGPAAPGDPRPLRLALAFRPTAHRLQAVKRRQLGAVAALLKAGAEVDEDTFTLALACGDQDCLKLLQRAKPGRSFKQARHGCRDKTFRGLAGCSGAWWRAAGLHGGLGAPAMVTNLMVTSWGGRSTHGAWLLGNILRAPAPLLPWLLPCWRHWMLDAWPLQWGGRPAPADAALPPPSLRLCSGSRGVA